MQKVEDPIAAASAAAAVAAAAAAAAAVVVAGAARFKAKVGKFVRDLTSRS